MLFRSNRIKAGIGPQSGLWPHGISGDLPIVLMLIEDTEDLPQLHQILAAHEYWRTRQLAVDLVILNERSASYVQDLQIAIDAAVRPAQLQPGADGDSFQVPGSIHTLRTDLITAGARALLLAVARVVLVASRGSIGQQIDALPDAGAEPPAPRAPHVLAAPDRPQSPEVPTLEFFNGLGGFAAEGREYVTILQGARPRRHPGSMSSPTRCSAFRSRPRAAAMSGRKTAAKIS